MNMKKILSSPLGIIITCFIALIIGLAAFMTIGIWPQSTARLERVANAFTPSSEWTLQNERINPQRHICLDSMCGEIRRVWRGPIESIKSCDEIYMMAKDFLGPRNAKNDVFKYGGDSPWTYITCDFKRKIDGISVTLSYDYHGDNKPTYLILQLDQ